MNIAAQILYLARLNPERPALVYGKTTTTYGVLARGVATTCARLRRLGLPADAIVAIETTNPIHHVALILALELCGLTSLSVQTRHAIDEAGLSVDLLLVDAGGTPDPTRRTVAIDNDWFALAPSIEPGPHAGVPADRYYRIILSSGTTGLQKAIGYRSALVGRFMSRTAVLRSEGENRVLGLLGFSTLGFLNPVLTLASGGTAYFAGSIAEALAMVRLYRIARLSFIGVAHLEALVAAARASGENYPSLECIQVSGSRVPPQLAAEARARLCGNLIIAYASTETGIISYGRFGAPGMGEGVAGHVLPWVEVQTIAADGQKLRDGAEGLLRVRSPDLAEYALPPGAPGQIEPGSWFYTGDIGFLREDGQLVITGRSGEVFNRRGIIVAPDYIEKVLLARPGIRQAAAFLHVNAAGLEEIWAAVVADAPQDLVALREACRPALGDKTPDKCTQVEALPRTDTGKVRRGALRQLFAVPAGA